MNRGARAFNFEPALYILLIEDAGGLDGTRRSNRGGGSRHRHGDGHGDGNGDEQVIRGSHTRSLNRSWNWNGNRSPLGAGNTKSGRADEHAVRAVHRNHRVQSLDLEQWVISWVNWNWQCLAIGAQVKVGARRVHALVADASDGLSTSNCIANCTMTNLVSWNLGRRSSSATTVLYNKYQ